MTPLTTYTASLSKQQADLLRSILESRSFEMRQVPYARFAGDGDKVSVVYYESGKLVVQGKGTQDFVEFTLEPQVLKEARLGYEHVHQPERHLPRLGIDESGKGDFFGPLCVAGVYVNKTIAEALSAAGVRDSKTISSDRKIAELAVAIRRTPGCITTVVPIGNEAYNRLYRKIGTVNGMLAWGHARVIENLLGQRHRMDPLPVRAISDQFAHDKATIERALLYQGREFELVQRHKAESDVAVAAASILARDEFVVRLQKLGREYDMKFPKGASKDVDAAATEFVKRFGADKLPLVSKTHFRTAFRAQGLPEPPRQEWRGPRKKNRPNPESARP